MLNKNSLLKKSEILRRKYRDTDLTVLVTLLRVSSSPDANSSKIL